MFSWLGSKKSLWFVTLLVVSLMMAGLLVGCGEEEEAEPPEENGEEEAEEAEEQEEIDPEIHFAKVEWTCSTQKSYVNKEILETLGYDMTLNNYAVPVLLEGLSDGQIDVFTDTWFATFGEPLEERLEDGRIIHLETHLEEAAYGPAVPVYVYEAGVTSLADLAEYSEEFDYTYYGLEPGNDGNQVMIDAFEDNTYGLGEWDIMESSESAMMQAVSDIIEDEEWVVFSGWEPHYMNVVFDMEYLDDPEGIWGEGESIGTITRAGLEEDDPNLTRYLEQFDVDADIVNEWVYEFGHKGRDNEEVAKEWVEENLDIVMEWVDGVTTVDGQDAQEVLQEAYN